MLRVTSQALAPLWLWEGPLRAPPCRIRTVLRSSFPRCLTRGGRTLPWGEVVSGTHLGTIEGAGPIARPGSSGPGEGRPRGRKAASAVLPPPVRLAGRPRGLLPLSTEGDPVAARGTEARLLTPKRVPGQEASSLLSGKNSVSWRMGVGPHLGCVASVKSLRLPSLSAGLLICNTCPRDSLDPRGGCFEVQSVGQNGAVWQQSQRGTEALEAGCARVLAFHGQPLVTTSFPPVENRQHSGPRGGEDSGRVKGSAVCLVLRRPFRLLVATGCGL